MPNFNLNDYEPVDARLHRFWDDIRASKLTATIETDLIEVARDSGGKPLQYVVKTTIKVSDGRLATGLAEELVGSSPVNRTSALENAETSSTGRALAQLGYSPKGSRPSAEEMAKAARTNGNGAKKKSAGASGDTPTAAVGGSGNQGVPAPDAPLDPNFATPSQWAQLVAIFGGKNAVVRAANQRFEGAVLAATDLTLTQAQCLIEESQEVKAGA